jgi:hypothetical protein
VLGSAVNVLNVVRTVKVFVSSPADVAPERGRVQAVATKLNREFEELIRFETVLWEEHFYKADRSFQPQIPETVACDVLVSIFWTRVGTELPADFARMPNGAPYPSGTAYELLTALTASKAKGVPDVYVFRKTADASWPLADAERLRQAQTQFQALESFWNEWFRSEQGHFKAAFQTFASTDEFERQIEQLLRQWIQSRGLLGPRLRWSKEKGSPFRGLAPFEAEHAAVFFGRDRAIDEARRRFVTAAADRGTAFLFIVGASGVGKSSLARAGLIPRLTTPGVVPSVDIWRVASMKPGEGQTGPVAALAAAMFAALPELQQGDFVTAGNLAEHLRRGGAPIAQPIVRALARAAEAIQHERRAEQPLRPTLLLLVDQLEELFAQTVNEGERAAFIECLKELVGSRQVWCVATLRADLYESLLRQPLLKAMKESGASFDLGPPTPAELAEIVRAPAAAAGLLLETDPDHGPLDERLIEDAKGADSLPLLQFTLRQLYDHRQEINGQTYLTHAAYRSLGGLQGAIAAEAERAVANLPPGALDALPRLLRRLAEPARDGSALTLREMMRADVAAEPAELSLVDALLNARILIAGQDAAGRSTLRLAHDAVLTSWPKAKAAAQASREFYRIRSDVEDALRRWREQGRRKDRLIQSGVPLAEAEKLAADFGAELPAEVTGYIGASQKQARLRQRLVAAAAVVFLAIAIVAGSLGILARLEEQKANTEKQNAFQATARAQKAEANAVAAKNEAEASEQRAVAAQKQAEQSRDSERLTKNYIDRVGETLQDLTGFVPEETEALMRESIDAVRASGDLDVDKAALQQIKALEDMAHYFYDSWDGQKAKATLKQAHERLQHLNSTAIATPSANLLQATQQEIAGDIDANDARDYGNSEREYLQALHLFELNGKSQGGAIACARVHRKLAALKIAQNDFSAADTHIHAAGQLLDHTDEALDERAELDDVAAGAAAKQNKAGAAQQLLADSIEIDRRLLDDARRNGQPILRLDKSLAIHLQHLGDSLRSESKAAAYSAYDEAETLVTEILETYPNQAGVRFIVDLIRHGRSSLAAKGIARIEPAKQNANDTAVLDTFFAQGYGRFKFGMSSAQVNGLLDHPFATIDPSQLPRAAEYWTGDVRYFWTPVAELTDFRDFYPPIASCLDNRLDYVVFMFHENSLMRISYRVLGPIHNGSCGDRRAFLPHLAERFHMPLLGTPKQWRLHWETQRASIIGTTYDLGPMLDIVQR